MVSERAVAERGPSEMVSAVEDGTVTRAEVGRKLGLLIQHAHDWAARVQSEAETEAIKAKERARQQAQKLVEEAEHEAAAIRRRAEQDASERIAYAQARVQELRDAIAAVAEHGATIRSHLLTAADSLSELDTEVGLPDGVTVDASLIDLDDEVSEPVEGTAPEGDAV